MTKYKAYRIIDGKSRWIVVNENGDIINRSPNKEELKDLEREKCCGGYRYTKYQLLSILK